MNNFRDWHIDSPAVVRTCMNLMRDFISETREGGHFCRREGGYFCIYHSVDGPDHPPLVSCLIGNVGTTDDRLRYSKSATEEALRLMNHPEHLSSWQSRDKNSERYGGAVLTSTGLIFSFSGLTEHADEATMAIAARSIGILPKTDMRNIAKFSKNKLLKRFLQER